MNTNCNQLPNNKKEYIRDIGKILVEKHGKKPFYKPEEVKEAHKSSSWAEPIDYSCWAMSTYSSHTDFDQYHEMHGEVCDYSAMRTEILQDFSHSDISNLLDTNSDLLDSSWLDFDLNFGDILEGIGDFLAGIADGN